MSTNRVLQLREAQRRYKAKRLQSNENKLGLYVSDEVKKKLYDDASKNGLNPKDYLEHIIKNVGNTQAQGKVILESNWKEEADALSDFKSEKFKELNVEGAIQVMKEQAKKIRQLSSWVKKLQDINDLLMKR